MGCMWSIGPSMLMLYSITFVSSIILVTNNFVYKYIQLCMPSFLQIYWSPKWLVIIVAINAAIVLNWIAMSTFCGWPSAGFIHFVTEYGLNVLHFDLRNSTFMGISMKYGLTPVTLSLLIEALLLVLVLGGIGLLCAMNIHLCLKQNSMSTRTRRMHRQMLTLLLLQTGCPLLLLHAPLYTMYALLFTGATSPEILNYVIGILMALFPFVCPMITLTFMKDYRNFLLIKLFLRKMQRTDTSTIILKKGIDNGKPVFVVPRTITRISV
ncbi:hypothetical protein Y032_0066g3743 [Ancylostoma ceylanicum]|uniref:7TM chemoreceptor n=3 Tax=Ancylostoma ceylanicum TaxID=53326 RepID=A0A016U060_9BILA|nr:hypothetical protein Y032_0066g3743 [Ancylostoma ceylanicum]